MEGRGQHHQLREKAQQKGRGQTRRRRYIRETLTGYGQYVITHEILHNFGLKHPNDNGLDPNFTQKDTVMSYRWDGNYYGIAPLDQQALQYLWGADPGIA